MFHWDPRGKTLELKAFRDPSQMFAEQSSQDGW